MSKDEKTRVQKDEWNKRGPAHYETKKSNFKHERWERKGRGDIRHNDRNVERSWETNIDISTKIAWQTMPSMPLYVNSRKRSQKKSGEHKLLRF
jgi:uncharacterized protein involved in outer membrane biogenesis